MNVLYRYHTENIDFGWGDYDGRTALHLAVCGEQMEVVKFLVKKCKVNINAPDRYLIVNKNHCNKGTLINLSIISLLSFLRWNTTPIDDALKIQNSSIYNYLRKNGAISFNEGEGHQDASGNEYQIYH